MKYLADQATCYVVNGTVYISLFRSVPNVTFVIKDVYTNHEITGRFHEDLSVAAVDGRSPR